MDLESEGTPDFMAEGIAAFQEALSSEEAEPAPEPAEALGDAEKAAEGEEVSEEGEELKEEKKEEPEVVAKSEFEDTVAKAQKEKKALIKRLKEEGDKARAYEQQIESLRGEGIETAREVAALMKEKNFAKVFEKFGYSGDDVLNMYKGYIDNPDFGGKPGDTEKIKESLKMKELRAKEEQLAQREAQAQRDGFKTTAKGLVNKFAENLPLVEAMIAAQGDSVLDQILDDITTLVRSKDPLLVGCTTVEQALKKVLPFAEKNLRKKYEPIVNAFSKVKPKASKEEVKPEVKSEEKKQPEKKAEAKSKEETKQKPVLKGRPSSTGAQSSTAPKRTQDFVNDGIRAFIAAGGAQ